MLNQADAVQNGATILVQFDTDDPPERIVELQDAVEGVEQALRNLKARMGSPMDPDCVKNDAEVLTMWVEEVADLADELHTAAKASTGLNVTTGPAA